MENLYTYYIAILIIVILVFCYMVYDRETYDWSFVDKVVYINLEDRVDRKQLIEKELIEKIPPEKIYRFNAIKDSPGHIGCTKSHIGVLELAIRYRWRNVLVVEDDAMFHKYKKGYRTLKRLVEQHPNFDVITLGNVGAQFDPQSLRLYNAQTTTAYLVNGPYYETLLSNFKQGLDKLLVTKTMDTDEERFPIEQQYAIDQYWKHLQRKDQWYIVNPALMIQRPDRSSILNGVVDYRNHFNL